MMLKPLAIDLFCGLGGWTDGLLAEGYDVIGFDIERHQYGGHRYPATLVIQDVTTLHGAQFKDAALIVASPPCQGYSYRAMPWSRAKALPPPDNTLFEACFRIQREASEAAGKHIPMIVENVRGAQKWVGRARWNYGSFYLWGDVPALMPITFKASKASGHSMSKGAPKWNMHHRECVELALGVKNGGDWFGSGKDCSLQRRYSGTKQPGIHGVAVAPTARATHGFRTVPRATAFDVTAAQSRLGHDREDPAAAVALSSRDVQARGVAMLTATTNPTWRGYTWVQLQRCAERELTLRRQVYPNRVLTNRMSRQQADAEIDKMRVIAEHLAELAERERLL